MGIGEYHDKTLDLPGIGADYKNCVHAFNNMYNYSVFYKDHNDKNVYATHKIDLKTAKISRSVKIEWAYDDIIQFFQQARDVIVKNKHDALITIISSHGEGEGVIIDSNQEEVSLIEIFWLFTRDECSYLQDKPKIMFIDACRGSLLSKVASKKKNDTNKSNDNNDKDMDKNSNSDNTEFEDKDAVSTMQSQLKTKSVSLKSQQDNQDVTNTDTATDTEVKSANMSNKEEKSHEKTTETQLSKAYHKEGNYRFIYANVDGYAVVEGGKRGGYLIRALHGVFADVETVLSSNLDNIVHQIRKQAKERVGTRVVVQQVEDVDRIDGIVTFQKKEIKETKSAYVE